MVMLSGESDFDQDRIFTPWTESEGDEKETLPTELDEFFSVHDADPKFQCTIQSFNNEMYTGRPSIIGEFSAEVPNYEKLVRMNGAKYYRYKIRFKKNGVPTTKNIDVDLSSKNWQALEKEGDAQRRTQKMNLIKSEMEEQNMYNAFGGRGPEKSGSETLKESIESIAPLLALLKGDNNGGGNNNQMMQMMFLMMNEGSKRAEQNSQNMMQMMMMMSKTNSDQMIAMMNNRPDTSNEFDKFFTLAERMNGFQNMVSPKEESLIDKIGGFISNNMDTIGAMLSKPKDEREKDPDFQDASNSWKMKAIKKKVMGNKAFAEKLINHLDQKVGPENTDNILEGFMKYTRQEATQEEPPAQAEQPKNDLDSITPSDFED